MKMQRQLLLGKAVMGWAIAGSASCQATPAAQCSGVLEMPGTVEQFEPIEWKATLTAQRETRVLTPLSLEVEVLVDNKWQSTIELLRGDERRTGVHAKESRREAVVPVGGTPVRFLDVLKEWRVSGWEGRYRARALWGEPVASAEPLIPVRPVQGATPWSEFTVREAPRSVLGVAKTQASDAWKDYKAAMDGNWVPEWNMFGDTDEPTVEVERQNIRLQQLFPVGAWVRLRAVQGLPPGLAKLLEAKAADALLLEGQGLRHGSARDAVLLEALRVTRAAGGGNGAVAAMLRIMEWRSLRDSGQSSAANSVMAVISSNEEIQGALRGQGMMALEYAGARGR